MFWSVFPVWLTNTESQFYFSSLWQCLAEIHENDLVSHRWSWRRESTLLCPLRRGGFCPVPCMWSWSGAQSCHPRMAFVIMLWPFGKMQVSYVVWVFFKCPKQASQESDSAWQCWLDAWLPQTLSIYQLLDWCDMHLIHFEENVCHVPSHEQPSFPVVALSKAGVPWRSGWLGLQLPVAEELGTAQVSVCTSSFIT